MEQKQGHSSNQELAVPRFQPLAATAFPPGSAEALRVVAAPDAREQPWHRVMRQSWAPAVILVVARTLRAAETSNPPRRAIAASCPRTSFPRSAILIFRRLSHRASVVRPGAARWSRGPPPVTRPPGRPWRHRHQPARHRADPVRPARWRGDLRRLAEPARSQISTVASSLAEASQRPSGEMASSVIWLR